MSEHDLHVFSLIAPGFLAIVVSGVAVVIWFAIRRVLAGVDKIEELVGKHGETLAEYRARLGSLERGHQDHGIRLLAVEKRR